MSIEDEILDLPEDKLPVSKRDFKALRLVALFFFILALLFRYNQWAGQIIFLMVGAFLFCSWALAEFLFTDGRKLFDWLYLFGRVGLGVGLTLRFVYNTSLSPYLVYASIAVSALAFWLHSHSAGGK